MSAINWQLVSQAVKAAAGESIASCRRADPSGAHYVQRDVQILAIDDQGERIGDPLEYLRVKECSGKRLQAIVTRHAPAQYRSITIQGGIDAYDSLKDMLAGGDYDPMVDSWDINTADIPSQGERIPLEQCQPVRQGGQSVADRITRADNLRHLRAQEGY